MSTLPLTTLPASEAVKQVPIDNQIVYFAVIVMVVTIAIELLACLGYHLAYMKKNKILVERQCNLERLREEYYKRSSDYIEANNMKIKSLENELSQATTERNDLKLEIERLQCSNKIANIDMKREHDAIAKVRASTIYRVIQDQIMMHNGRPLKLEEWDELTKIIDDAFGDFSNKLLSYCNLNAQEFHVCLLLKIGIKPNDISMLTAHSKQSISTIRNRLFRKVFGDKGSGKDWDEFIYSL